MRYRLRIEYDGRPYMGWQRQVHGDTVQGAIESALQAITGTPAALHAAGRTDAGVHAVGQVAHVDLEWAFGAFRLMEAINARLHPAPIAIVACEEAPEDWHARFSCIGRRYCYTIINRRPRLTMAQGLAWRVPQALDASAMHEAAQSLLGQHDFTTFRAIHCQSQSPIKTLDQLDVVRDGETIRIYAAARSFLHHQVRSMVGCLKLVGQGYWTKADLVAALEARNRTRLGLNAPPDGLCFMEAIYPAEQQVFTAPAPSAPQRA